MIRAIPIHANGTTPASRLLSGLPDDRTLALPVRHDPPEQINNTLVTPVDARVRDTRRALLRLDLAQPAVTAARALGLGDGVTIHSGGFLWRPDGAQGHVDVQVDIRVEPGPADEASLLTITTRFAPTDEASRGRLLDAWTIVGPLTQALARRAAHSVKTYAEDDRFEVDEATAGDARAA